MEALVFWARCGQSPLRWWELKVRSAMEDPHGFKGVGKDVSSMKELFPSNTSRRMSAPGDKSRRSEVDAANESDVSR